jgi:hypothetical protein
MIRCPLLIYGYKIVTIFAKIGFYKHACIVSEKVQLGFSSNFAKNYFNIWTITSRF